MGLDHDTNQGNHCYRDNPIEWEFARVGGTDQLKHALGKLLMHDGKTFHQAIRRRIPELSNQCLQPKRNQ